MLGIKYFHHKSLLLKILQLKLIFKTDFYDCLHKSFNFLSLSHQSLKPHRKFFRVQELYLSQKKKNRIECITLIKKSNVLKPVKLVNIIKIDVYTCVMLTDEPREKALERHKRWKTYQAIGQV